MRTTQEIRAQRVMFLNEEIKELYWIEIIVCRGCNGLYAPWYQECRCAMCKWEPLFK